MGKPNKILCIPSYNMVKDHRTSVETGNVQAVMDGNIDQFIEGYLKKEANLTV